ncbi:MAG: hypothetical protein EBU08_08820 [Micrococcales bacterium]|nr:hypothetical protein [Micrococcales bacterium]
MRREYLEKTGLLSRIHTLTDGYDHLSLKERIDLILKLQTNRSCVVCHKQAKPDSKWCSLPCRNKDPGIRANTSSKNKENSDQRARSLRKTLIERYDVECVQNIPAVKEQMKQIKQGYYDRVIEETFKKYSLDLSLLSDHDYLSKICNNSSYHELSAQHFNSMPVMTILRHFNRIQFDPKFPKSSSRAEREIREYLLSFLSPDEVLSNDRKVISPKELDIYIPSKNIAIEYHGLYWHSGDKTTHKNKMKLCENEGIQLLQIFEDEWAYKQDIVKSILKSKIGYIDRTYNARDLMIEGVSSERAREFMMENHIQGFVPGHHFALIENHTGDIISCMTIGKSRFEKRFGLELLRFASKLNTNVRGGFSKILNHIKKVHSGVQIVSYADLRYSTGAVYEKHGTKIRETAPGYFWCDTKKIVRIPRYSTQKSKLSKLLGSAYDPMKSEIDNMNMAGYVQIWDAGHRLYLL